MKKISIVSTPIGNLKDITLRALEILKDADVILCEDTRVSSKLLNHYQISNKHLISYHKFNEYKSLSKISLLLEQDKKIALISDAGTPLISDPGQILVEYCHNNSINLEVIPGPSAVTSAFALSGFNLPFIFIGFLKETSSQRVKQLEQFLPDISYVFFVSPYKLIATLEDIEKVFKNEAKLFLIKEMTKIHERYFLGSATDIKQALGENVKGEFTLVLRLESEIKLKVKKNKYEKYSKIFEKKVI
ncbi:16S rRNA (cytidine(1402)-2'-O)-methyltransferase [Mesomycoplasma hyorhinis]|uniref:16S rRNA (cytidine(1402)-2'-O)-methyltransferase n=1 Tax=Mesomycoplasma hyorhinis TaxID=2100 RepID=UPI0001E13236|nr:16S rRNA (cytidine(1402)-2'-O)-methyltransferase [Mesomycoplasma hyorhinis]ADM21578.1 Ribosomal RNA small subunit methyltransferase I [Mesomycoplasma hyorhinis HUB-1]